jgi:2-polyprenyl-3-methyl-5-hydroxy-6-metoxy-1,4-benzoquinol methylase
MEANHTMPVYDRKYFEQNKQLNDRPAIRWYARVCERLLPPGRARIFEYGCGIGWLMRRLERNNDVEGYDPNNFSCEQARVNAPRSKIYTDAAHVPESSYDLVVALHVLEHVPDPKTTLQYLADRLKPNGQLLFVVPAQNGLGHRLRGEKWFAYRDPTHVSLLAESEWRKMVHDAGLEIITEAGDGLWDAPYIRLLPRLVQLPLFGASAAIQVYFGRGKLFVPAAWSECLIIVARKSFDP